MKKMFMVGAAVLMAVGAMFVSCGDIANGCSCTVGTGYYSITYTYTKSEVSATGVNTCAAFAAQEEAVSSYSWSCSPAK